MSVSEPEGPTFFHDLEELLDSAPRDLGCSGWIRLDGPSVDAFRRATLLPLGGDTGVPPLMLVAITNRLLPEVLQVPAASSGVNYGAESVRFGAPVPVGERVRARAALLDAVRAGEGVQTMVEIVIEAESAAPNADGAAPAPEPACVVRSLSRWNP